MEKPIGKIIAAVSAKILPIDFENLELEVRRRIFHRFSPIVS